MDRWGEIVQRLYLLDRVLCYSCKDDKDEYMREATFEEQTHWRPHPECCDCRYLRNILEYADRAAADTANDGGKTDDSSAR